LRRPRLHDGDEPKQEIRMPGTLVGIFLEAVARYRKSDQFKRKR